MNLPPASFHPSIAQRTELELRPHGGAGLPAGGGAEADAAAWFLGGGADAGARITLGGAPAGPADVATLAQRVLSHLTG
ncbi:hypothetical protein [Ideonella sp. BN130291]|uniref:hypothetical protein n=1 Tax=Ideonella sp. BN130291 TaxID=3112940 RepID=UPI002E262BF6|nr:hypothetical protein [Ideonella sp. BN130291]